LGIVAAQGVLLGAAIYSFGGYRGILCYMVCWLVPLVKVYPFIIRVRTVTEHYSDELHHSDGPAFISRTSLTGWLERYLIGADMEFHLEHHLNPAIPHYRLRQLNRELERRGVFERMGKHKAKLLNDGYLKF
jgi:fatty acid desaturase